MVAEYRGCSQLLHFDVSPNIVKIRCLFVEVKGSGLEQRMKPGYNVL